MKKNKNSTNKNYLNKCFLSKTDPQGSYTGSTKNQEKPIKDF